MIVKHHFLFFRFLPVLILWFMSFFLNAQEWNNVITGTSNGMTEGTAIDYTSGGSICFTGNFRNDFSIGTFHLPGHSFYNGMIGKCSPDGTIAWVESITSTRDISMQSVRVSDQFLLVAGEFSDSLFIRNDTLVNAFQKGIFLSLFDTSGNYFASITPVVESASIFDVLFSEDKQIYVTGQFYKSFELDGFELDSPTDFNMFTFKYDLNTQTTEWLIASDGYGTSGNGIDLDEDGNIYIIGSYGDNTSILGNLLDNNNSNHNFYVLKTDSNGNFQWVKTIRGEGQVHGTAITVAKNGTSYFTGDFQLSADSLAGSVITAEGFSSALVGKLDHNGELVWLEAIGGTGEDKGVDVLLDSLEAPIFLINSGENPYIGSISVALNGFVEPLLVKLHPDNGALVWQQTISAQSPSGTVNPLGMACFDGCIAVIGRNRTGLVFENTLYEAPYLRDFFIATVQDTTFLPVSIASLPDQQEDQFTLFPNPSAASFHLAGADKLKQVEIYTTSGRLVQRISQPDNNLPFSFGETLYPGNYIFRMTDTEGYQYTVIGVKIQ